jgi:hypothetical protein
MILIMFVKIICLSYTLKTDEGKNISMRCLIVTRINLIK